MNLDLAVVALLSPVEQSHLDEARQMQALSFVVHIPIVCFGLALPSLVLFVEWMHLRTGRAVYRVLARRWSKVMVALFAVGAVTGTILSFEMGLLWPGFVAGRDAGRIARYERRAGSRGGLAGRMAEGIW